MVGVRRAEGKPEMRAGNSDTNGLHWDKGSWEGVKGGEIRKYEKITGELISVQGKSENKVTWTLLTAFR